MKYLLLCITALFGAYIVNAQVGIGTLAPNSSAQLDITSTTRGLLIPRVDHIQYNILAAAAASPATGLIVYLTDVFPGFWYNKGTPAAPSWIQIAAGPTIGNPVGVSDFQTLSNKNLVDGTTFFQNITDGTKKMRFELSTYSTGITHIINLPDADLTLVGTNTTQSLSNKTLLAPVINGSVVNQLNGGILNLPLSGGNGNDNIVGRFSVDALYNKSLVDNINYFIDDLDNTKKLQLQLSGISTATTRTWTIPDASSTLVGTDVVQTLSNKTLTLPVISSISNTGTLTLPTSTDVLVARNTTDNLANKSLLNNSVSHVDNADISKKINFSTSGAATGTVLTITGVQTVSRIVTLPDATTTLVGRNTVDALTNKTLTDATNTITAAQLRTTGADVVISGTVPPVAGQVLTAAGATTASWQNSAGKHVIGESYQGGTVFWVDPTGYHGLIATNVDIPNPGSFSWDNGSTPLTNAKGDGIYAGALNTGIIIPPLTTAIPANDFAARLCSGFVVNSGGADYGGWYLPSKYELNLMYAQRAILGIVSGNYWSSTEVDATNAWSQSFTTGTQFNNSKLFILKLRGVRSF